MRQDGKRDDQDPDAMSFMEYMRLVWEAVRDNEHGARAAVIFGTVVGFVTVWYLLTLPLFRAYGLL